jgi:CarD family transcriptional regulator
MFQIGAKIFYPMHGAGIVEAIEEKEILGEKQLYYILNMTLTDMQVMIPTRKTADSLLRQVVDSNTLENALVICHQKEEEPEVYPHQKKQRIYMDKIKSGDIYEGAQVIRDLMSLSKNKKLNTADKIILNHAQQMFISELSLVLGLDQEQASHLLNRTNHFNTK